MRGKSFWIWRISYDDFLFISLFIHFNLFDKNRKKGKREDRMQNNYSGDNEVSNDHDDKSG